jgi:hypothetical protein
VPKAAKYPIDHIMFHHGAAVSGLAAIVTGILMMLRIDTWFWTADPYIMLSESSWGVVYIVHGVSGVALFALIITHIYFAIRPDKWWITKSMIYGFIGRDKYVENFDPARWAVPGAAPQEEQELVPAGVGASVAGASTGGGESEAPDSGTPGAPDTPQGDSGGSGDSSSDERSSEVGGQD